MPRQDLLTPNESVAGHFCINSRHESIASAWLVSRTFGFPLHRPRFIPLRLVAALFPSRTSTNSDLGVTCRLKPNAGGVCELEWLVLAAVVFRASPDAPKCLLWKGQRIAASTLAATGATAAQTTKKAPTSASGYQRVCIISRSWVRSARRRAPFSPAGVRRPIR